MKFLILKKDSSHKSLGKSNKSLVTIRFFTFGIKWLGQPTEDKLVDDLIVNKLTSQCAVDIVWSKKLSDDYLWSPSLRQTRYLVSRYKNALSHERLDEN